ncbi:MAG TPA: PAS domain S-box protein, partial [Burkholderiaceae bacterium]|nr:PAS domain S-box protein [Burkholderiaceae bacterium]
MPGGRSLEALRAWWKIALHRIAERRDSRQRYRALFESLDEGFCVLDVIFDAAGQPVDFRILEVNPAFERQTGLHDAVGRRMREIAADSEQHWFDTYGAVASTGRPARFERRARALGRWFDVYAFPLGRRGGHRVGVLFNDITQRRHADQALRASEARSRLALDVAQLGTWSWRGAGNLLSADARFRELCGFGPDEPLSVDGVMSRVHADDSAAADAAVREALAPSGDGRFRAEIRYVQPDGELRWLVARGMTEFVSTVGGRCPARMLGTVMDVTARKRTEQELLCARDELELRVRERTAELACANAALRIEIADREAAGDRIRHLLGRLVDAQEEERRRLSRELHDTLGQNLAVLTLGLKAMRAQPGWPPELTERLSYVEQAAGRLEEDVDRLSYELRPLALDNMELVEALRQYADEWSAECGIAADVQVHGLPSGRLSAAAEATVYRVVQEAFTNARKHAAATHVSLIAERRGSQLRVIVEDDGRGFDAATVSAAADNRRRLGLRGMAERAALVTGSIEIESAPGHGTAVYLTVPLDVGEPADTTITH